LSAERKLPISAGFELTQGNDIIEPGYGSLFRPATSNNPQ